MLVSLNLLNKFVKIDDLTPDFLANAITKAGIEVEGYEPLAQGTCLKVGYVEERIQHPESNKLSVCQVNIGEETIQIVCGAPNVRAGLKVIVATNGARLENAKIKDIKKVSLAGLESNGMICSLSELGVKDKYLTEDQLAGIEELPSDAPVGVEALSYLGLNDYILELSPTPNRNDVLAYIALAKEVGAILDREVNELDVVEESETTNEYTIALATDKCPAFALKAVSGVEITQTQASDKLALMANEISSINNVVDAAALTMLYTGNPIHCYDADKLGSKHFEIRNDVETTFIGLDKNEYKVELGDIVVTNAGKVVALAGVMGSLCSCIDENTKNIVIEAAVFDAVSIRNTSKRLNLFTDAATRFAKNINQATIMTSLELVAKMVGGTKSNPVLEGSLDCELRQVSVTLAKINNYLGLDLSLDIVLDIMRKLKFAVELNGEQLNVTIPTYRQDITLDVDLVEEVARLYGYDNLRSTLPVMQSTTPSIPKNQKTRKYIKNYLTSQNIYEAVTYQLTSSSRVDLFDCFDHGQAISLALPLSDDRKYLRKTILGELIHTLKYNIARQNTNINLFEISQTYSQGIKQEHLAIILNGVLNETKYAGVEVPVDFYTIKGIFEGMMAMLGFDSSRYQLQRVEQDHELLHPGRSCYILFNKKKLGFMGQLHPNLQKQLKVNDSYVCEINLDLINANTGRKNKYEQVSVFPTITRDLALVADKEVTNDAIMTLLRQNGKPFLKEIELIDIYTGEKIASDKKCLTYSLKFNNEKETLKDEDIKKAVDTILNALENKLQVTLRS